MKTFKTAKGAYNHIIRNAQTGREKELNGVLSFGMGIYAYSDVVTFSGVADCTDTGNAFYHFKSEKDILDFILWIQKTDNYLIIQ